MFAQLRSTLSQLPDFRSLSLIAGGQEISAPSADLSAFDLSAPGSGELFFASDKGISRALPGFRDVSVLAIPATGDSAKSLRAPLVNASRTALLAIDADGTLIGSELVKSEAGISGTSFASILRPPRKLLQPQLDQASNYWLMGIGAEPALVSGQGIRFPVKVSLPDVGAIESFAIARDGVRLVISVRSKGISTVTMLRLSRKGSAIRAEAPIDIWSSQNPVLDMKASSASQILLLVGGDRLFTLDLLTRQVSGPESVPRSVSLAAHPGHPVVLETLDHRLLVKRNEGWTQFTTGRDPSYAG